MYTEKELLEAVDILIEDYELTENEALNIINEYQGNLAHNPTKIKGSRGTYLTRYNKATNKLDREANNTDIELRRNNELYEKRDKIRGVKKEVEKEGKEDYKSGKYYDEGYKKGKEEHDKQVERDGSNIGRYKSQIQQGKDNIQYKNDKKYVNKMARNTALKTAAASAALAGGAIVVHKAYKKHQTKKEEERLRAEEEARKNKKHKGIKRLRENYGILEKNNELYIKNESVEYFMESYNIDKENAIDMIIESYTNELNEAKSLYNTYNHNTRPQREINNGPQRRRGESLRHYASRERESNYKDNKNLYDEREHQKKLKALDKEYENKKEQEKQKRRDEGYKDGRYDNLEKDITIKSWEKESEYSDKHNKDMKEKYKKLNKSAKRKVISGAAAGAVVGAGAVVLAHKAYKKHQAKKALRENSILIRENELNESVLNRSAIPSSITLRRIARNEAKAKKLNAKLEKQVNDFNAYQNKKLAKHHAKGKEPRKYSQIKICDEECKKKH